MLTRGPDGVYTRPSGEPGFGFYLQPTDYSRRTSGVA